MSESAPPEGVALALPLLKLVDVQCDAFEAALQEGRRPRIEEFLGDTPEPARAGLFEELLRLELEYRLAWGARATPEEYWPRFPEYAKLIGSAFLEAVRVGPEGMPGSEAPAEWGPPATGSAPPPTPADEAPTRAAHSERRPAATGDLPAVPGYQVLEELGRGGMGVVLRVYDPDLGRALAVKVPLDRLRGQPDLLARFLEEAQITGQLDHPGIPPVHGVGRLDDGRPFFAMKLVKGRTLADLLQGRKAPSEGLPRWLAVFRQLCEVLAYAHSQGVIHRDLKTANVMVGAYGEVQVMDWGLAKVLRRVLPAPKGGSAVRTVRTALRGLSTQTGDVAGTLAYMAPEQARGEVELLDERCDVFGLGAILCEILTGHPPYWGLPRHAESDRAVRGDLREAFARLEACGTDVELVGLAKDCLAPRREDRPRDAKMVAEAVEACEAGAQERLRQAELGRARVQVRVAEERKRRQLIVVAAVAVVTVVAGLLLGAGAWYVREQHEQTRQNVERCLTMAEAFLRQNRLTEADGALKQAVSELGEPWPEDLRLRLRQDQQDLDLAGRLERLRLQKAIAREGSSPPVPAASQYAAALRSYGLDLAGDRVGQLSAKIEGRTIKEQLVAALDDWAAEEPDERVRARLLAVARRADPGEWGDRFRDAAVRRDRRALQQLAEEAEQRLARGADGDRLSPVKLMALAESLERSGGDALSLLRRSLWRHPSDFWLNLTLANALLRGRPPWQGEEGRPEQPGAALRYYGPALAVRPEVGAVYVNLGVALMNAGCPREAAEAFRKAVGMDAEYGVCSAVAGFYARAFEREPGLADDLGAGHRYLAARAAALAARLERGGGQGLRDRAAGWLRAELAAWTRVLEQDPLRARAVQQALRRWQTDPDLEDLRAQAALAELWADVDALVKRGGSPG
jgi:hypothetical protein